MTPKRQLLKSAFSRILSRMLVAWQLKLASLDNDLELSGKDAITSLQCLEYAKIQICRSSIDHALPAQCALQGQ